MSSVPSQVQIPALKVEMQSLLAVGAELAGDGSIAVITFVRGVDAHPHGVRSRVQRERKGYGLPGGANMMCFLVNTNGAVDLVVIAQFAVNPNVNFAGAERILAHDLQVSGKGRTEVGEKNGRSGRHNHDAKHHVEPNPGTPD